MSENENRSVEDLLNIEKVNVIENEDEKKCPGCNYTHAVHYSIEEPEGICADCMMEIIVNHFDCIPKRKRISVDEILEQRARVGRAMEATGGHFFESLGKAVIRADIKNTIRIYNAFQDDWEMYNERGLKNNL